MSAKSGYPILFFVIAAVVCCLWLGMSVFAPSPVTIEEYVQVSAPANIKPDYSGIVIPPNIGPLNFVIHEPAA